MELFCLIQSHREKSSHQSTCGLDCHLETKNKLSWREGEKQKKISTFSKKCHFQQSCFMLSKCFEEGADGESDSRRDLVAETKREN